MTATARFAFTSGLHNDRWLSSIASAELSGVSTLELDFYVPSADTSPKKLKIVLNGGTARSFPLNRAKPTRVTLQFKPWEEGRIEFEFSPPETTQRDTRTLGAVLMRVILDGNLHTDFWPVRRGPEPAAPPAEIERLDNPYSSADLEAVSEYFDADAYRSLVPATEVLDDDLLVHYMTVGWKQGLNPSSRFSTAYYLRSNPEINAAGLNPLLHYVRHGRREKRPPMSYVEQIRPAFRPLVSVIIPNYNHARYLPQRIESVYQQTYRNIELILLDDCSTDNSVEELGRLSLQSPFPVRVAINDRNSGGVFHQWERGLSMAKGDLVWICESDDFCEQDFLEHMVRHFADRAVMIAFGRIQLVSADGSVNNWLDSYRENAEPGIWEEVNSRPTHAWFTGGFARNNLIANVGGCVFRNQVIPPETWSVARSFRICGDWYLYMQIAQGGKITFDPGAIAYFRQHGSNTSASNFDKLYYYEEHLAVFAVMNTLWDLPDSARAAFMDGLRRQWLQHRMDESHGGFDAFWSSGVSPVHGSRRKHVLIGSLGFMAGGGELFPIHLANALVAQGVAVSMLCINLSDSLPDLQEKLDPRVAVYDREELQLLGARAFVRHIGADVVHSHVVNIDDLFFRSGSCASDIPYVVTMHGSHECDVGRIEALLFRMLRGVTIWVYTADKNLLLFGNAPLDHSRFLKLSNAMPLDTQPFPLTRSGIGIDDETVVFTFVARGVQQKGWRAVIEAVRRVVSARPLLKLHVLMVGDGKFTDIAREMAGPDLPVTFLGFQARINGLYRISDVALLPSRFTGESFPLCLIQALQEGLPVLATDIGEIRAMVTEGGETAGELLPNIRDSEVFFDELALGIIRMTDPDRRAAAARVARRLSGRFDMNRLATEYLEVYETAMRMATTETGPSA